MAQAYVGSYTGIGSGAALVHLPTGAGKSGVIAMLARVSPGIGDVLVLTPRTALRDQLFGDIRSRFFQRLARCPAMNHLPKTVHCLTDEPADVNKLPPSSCVFVATIQSWYSWHKRERPISKILLSRVKLVVIDEGHCEPATCWREAIRAFNRPRVLCSATPYRNDLKIFDINFDHTSCLSHAAAVRAGFLRELEVVPRPRPADVAAFVKDVTTVYDERFGPGATGTAAPRAIIRCDNYEQIRQIAAALIGQGRTCVALHERFTADAAKPHERRAVPAPDSESAIFWVHQYKLVEGIDDSRFRLVAAYQPFSNARELVQQAGRVVRNPTTTAGEKAFLLDHSDGYHARLWRGYTAYDGRLEKEGARASLQAGQRLVEAWMEGQPPGLYLDGAFRVGLRLDQFDPSGLQLPLTANVYRKDAGFSLAAVRAGMEAACRDRDFVVRVYQPDGQTVLAVYFVLSNSPYLRDEFYVQNRLAVSVVRETADHVFAYDPGGVVPFGTPGLGDAVPPGDLKKLFKSAKGVRVTQVSLQNTTLSADTVRSRSLSARSIRTTVPLPDDNSSVCTRAEGYAPATTAASNGEPAVPTRRYTGFRTGRVSDYSCGFVPLTVYAAWVDEIAAVIGSDAKSADDFRRYSGEARAPEDPTPKHILLDLAEVSSAFVTNAHPSAADGISLDVEDACAEVTLNADGAGRFTMRANESTFDIAVRYDPDRTRYTLTGPDLESHYRRTDRGTPDSLIGYLNRFQSFRLLPQSPGYFFAGGRFFHPALRFGTKYDDEQLGLFKILHGVKRLGEISSEKGEEMKFPKGTWPVDSVFGLIDALGENTEMASDFGSPVLLVCDDMGTESADFILADDKALRVVFVHAKATKERHGYAASPLQEVCGQASKNLKYLAKFSEEGGPSKHKNWHTKEWKLDGESRPRLRRGTGTGASVWERVRAIIRDPRATCEVWLCLGNMLSVSKYQKALTAPTPKPEAVQAAYLLQGLMTAVAGVGARVKVWCSP